MAKSTKIKNHYPNKQRGQKVCNKKKTANQNNSNEMK